MTQQSHKEMKTAAAQRADDFRGEASSYSQQLKHLPEAEQAVMKSAATALLSAAEKLAKFSVMP